MKFAQIAKLASTVAILVVLCVFYGYFIEPNRLVVNNAELHIKGLNHAFDGFKIVAISDIHGGSNGGSEANIRRVVENANAQDADIIVLLGDYVSQTGGGGPSEEIRYKMPISTITENLTGLSARYGVFAVLGNHDGWYGDQAVSDALAGDGYRVLRNEIAIVEKNGQPLRLLGLNDHLKLRSWDSFDSDVRKIVAANEPRGDIVVLEHSPDIFQVLNHYKMLGRDLKLMIAGHTHGGQIWLPIIGSPIVPSSFGQKYSAGHVHEFDSDMFVTTGVGTSILPFRFMVPPEIAVLTLRSE